MWFFVFYLFVFVKSEFVINATGSADYYKSFPCTNKNHIFLTPGVLTAGSGNRACLSRFYTEGPAHLTLDLKTNERHLSTTTRDLPAGDGGCVEISVPPIAVDRVNMTVYIKYPEANCVWEKSVTLRVSSGRVVMLQTDRPRYRAGDTIRFRILVVKADLTPGHTTIEDIWIEGPSGSWGEGSRVTQWKQTRMKLGFTQLQYDLDDHADPGKWVVRAQLADGAQGFAEFWVGDYELPPFHMTVKHAPRVLRTSEKLVWHVCVRYPWSEATAGMLVVRLRGAGSDVGVHTAIRLRGRACHRHAVAAGRIGLSEEKTVDVVVADFSFQEEGTRIWQNTTVVTQVVDQRVSLEFMSKYRTVIAPGLPYKLKIKATRWDGKPASSEKLRVCKTPISHPLELHQNNVIQNGTNSDASCDDTVTDGRGIARVTFTAVFKDGYAFYKFEANLPNSTNSATLLLPVSKIARAALGPLSASGSFQMLPMYLNLDKLTTAITVHTVIITRGGTIHRWGTTTQCPIANSGRARSASRNSECHYYDARYNTDPTYYNSLSQEYNKHGRNASNTSTSSFKRDSDFLLDRKLLRVMLPVRLTHQMCPDSHFIAYFYHNGELISASKHIEVDDCFSNKVRLEWLTRQVHPRSSAVLQLTTQGPALCALSALDVTCKWMQPVPSIQEQMLKSLNALIDDHRNITNYDATGLCYMNEDNQEVPEDSLMYTTAIFSVAGVRLVTDEHKRVCDIMEPAYLTDVDDVSAPRTEFEESWLWRLVGVNANGTAIITATVPDSITRYETNAVCMARNGIGIAKTSTIQVFRDFFIHANGPRRMRNGDASIVEYRVFNYLYEPLAVQIQVLADPRLQILSMVTESACLPPRASISHRVDIKAKFAGHARMSLRASAENDRRCGNSTKDIAKDISDEVIIAIEVEHEGVPKQDHQSALLCGKDNNISSTSGVSWSWPKVEMVSGSASMRIWAVGSIEGPLLTNADSLTQLPRGCGEQNMARLASNLLALKMSPPRSSAAIQAKDHVSRGLARQLQYVHPNGGFSAFGINDGVPSTWLTAFSIRYMRRAHSILYPGSPIPSPIERAERWLMNQQMENGCFRNEGQVFHREMKGGLNEDGEIASVSLTAYVVTSLVESGVTLPAQLLRNSLACLRAMPPMKAQSATRVYAQTLLTYTLMRLKRYEDEIHQTNEASLMSEKVSAGLQQDEELQELIQLMKIAKRSDQFVWWDTGTLPTSIEATSYALLALSSCPRALETSCANDARRAVRWLGGQRGATGGFVSTQDTLVALEALTAWSAHENWSPGQLNLTVNCGGIRKVIRPEDNNIPVFMDLEVCDEMKVDVDGNGCALVQATRSYNTLSETAATGDLSVQVQVHTDGPFNCYQNFCYCAAVIEACVLWSGEFPEMVLLEVSLPGGYGVDTALLYAQLQQKGTLIRRIEISNSGSRISMYLSGKSNVRHVCGNVNVVGGKGVTKPAYVKVLDYYNKDVSDTQMYTIPEECPPRIIHEIKSNVGVDNLYNSARSFDGDPIIDNENNFDELPDIPLEDPLNEYFNLLKDSRSFDQEISFIEESDDYTNKKDMFKNEETKMDQNTAESVNAEVIDKTKTGNEIPKSENIKLIADNKENLQVDNPQLENFHVIDTDKDLEVPQGVEGPLPSVVLPPQGFIIPPLPDLPRPPSIQNHLDSKSTRQNPYFYYQGYTRHPAG